MTNKFKTDERVRVIKSNIYTGMEGTVARIVPSGSTYLYTVQFNSARGGSLNFVESRLESAEPRVEGKEIKLEDIVVGDEILVTEPIDDIVHTRQGVVGNMDTISRRGVTRAVTKSGKFLTAGSDNVTITLTKKAPDVHPVDAAKVGDSFEFVYLGRKFRYMKDGAEGFWIRYRSPESDHDKIVDVTGVRHEAAKTVFDAHDGEFVK